MNAHVHLREHAFGCWTATALVVRHGFANGRRLQRHGRPARLGLRGRRRGRQADGSNLQLDTTVGGSSRSTPPRRGQTRSPRFGYPAAGKYHGNDLMYCQGPVGTDPYTAGTTYRMACDMTGGRSGGPWLLKPRPERRQAQVAQLVRLLGRQEHVRPELQHQDDRDLHRGRWRHSENIESERRPAGPRIAEGRGAPAFAIPRQWPASPALAAAPTASPPMAVDANRRREP